MRIYTHYNPNFKNFQYDKYFAAWTDKGLCWLNVFGIEDEQHLIENAFNKIIKETLHFVPASEKMVKELEHNLLDYEFDNHSFKLDPIGTPFQKEVWEAIKKFTKTGNNTSYKNLASWMKKSSSIRPVATACANNKIFGFIPCHRVLNHKNLSGGYRWNVDHQMELLKRESAFPGTY